MDGQLIVISEGDMHMLKYLRANGLRPKSFVTNCSKFKELKPYISSNDTLLVIIKGFTDFTISEVYALMNDIEDVRGKLRAVVVVSNINLGNVPFEYYLYEGDLFYGSMKHVVRGKTYDIVLDDADTDVTIDTVKKKKVKAPKDKENKPVEINPVMQTFKHFNDNSLKVSYYGVEVKPEKDNVYNRVEEARIISVDLFTPKGV